MKKVTIILILSILLSAINGCASPSAENNQSDAETSIKESSSEQVVPESEDSESQMPQQAEEIEEPVVDTEDVAENFETDSTSGYANSFYQQGRNFYRNNNQ